MKNNKARRVFAALSLFFIATIIVTPVFAAEVDAWNNSQLEQMELEIMKWYNLAVVIVLPLFIVRFASYGISILGTLFMNKGEFQLDKIYKNILYAAIAVLILLLLPSIMQTAIAYFSSRGWDPDKSRVAIYPAPTQGGPIIW